MSRRKQRQQQQQQQRGIIVANIEELIFLVKSFKTSKLFDTFAEAADICGISLVAGEHYVFGGPTHENVFDRVATMKALVAALLMIEPKNSFTKAFEKEWTDWMGKNEILAGANSFPRAADAELFFSCEGKHGTTYMGMRGNGDPASADAPALRADFDAKWHELRPHKKARTDCWSYERKIGLKMSMDTWVQACHNPMVFSIIFGEDSNHPEWAKDDIPDGKTVNISELAHSTLSELEQLVDQIKSASRSFF